MTNPARQVPLTLRLDPQRESDRMALTTLHSWYQRAGMLNGGHEEFDFFGLQLHTNIYLSGLYLCLLEPKLVKYLSSQLQSSSLTPEFLHQALERHHLASAAEPIASAAPARAPTEEEQSFSDSLTEQLEQLKPEALANRIFDQLHPLLAAQNESSASNVPDEQLQSQVRVMAQQLQEQSRLLQEQSRLLNALSRNPNPGYAQSGSHSDGAGSTAPEQMQRQDLSATAANVRKVRDKGVF